MIDTILEYVPILPGAQAAQKLYIQIEKEDLFIVRALKTVLSKYPGKSLVRVAVKDTGRVYALEAKVSVSGVLARELENLVGKENVAFQ